MSNCKCGTVLTDETWYPSKRKRGQAVCIKCCNTQATGWRKANPVGRKRQKRRATERKLHFDPVGTRVKIRELKAKIAYLEEILNLNL